MTSPDTPAQNRERFWSPAFVVAVVVAFLVKMWLTADNRRVPLGAPYDDLNFVAHARAILDGKWLGDYTNLTLIKGPFYPMFIAAAADASVPLHIAEMLLHVLACVVAVIAVVPLVRRTGVRIALLLVLFFDPMTFESTTVRVMRGDIMEALTLLVIGLALWIFVRRECDMPRLVPASVALGLALSAFLMTREEGMWIYTFLGLIAGAYLAAPRPETLAALGRRSVPVAVAAGVAVMGYVAVATTNLVHYGWFTTVEVTSSEFTAAYGALARIEPVSSPADTAVDPRIPIRLSTLEQAYRVSPAARELQPLFDGVAGRTAARMSCEQLHICGGITGGWFLWIFRDAVAAAGHYSSGGEARRFYATLAEQIDRACAEKKLPCSGNRHTLAPRVPISATPRILVDALAAFKALITFDHLSFDAQPLPPTASVVDVFRSVTEDRLTVDLGDPHDHGLKGRLQHTVGSLYQTLLPVLVVLAAFVLFARLGRSLVLRRIDAVAVVSVCIAAGVATLLILLTIVDDYAFPAITPEYLKPLYAAALLGVTFTLTADMEFWLRTGLRLPAFVRSSYRVAGVAAALGFAALFLHAFVASAPGAEGFTAQSQAAAASPPGLDRKHLDALARLAQASTSSIDGVLRSEHGRWTVEHVNGLTVKKGALLRVVGWAADPRTMAPGRGLVLIVDSNRRDVTAEYGGNRPDVAAAYRQPAMQTSGFSVLVPTASLATGKHAMTFGVVSADGKGFYASKSLAFAVM